METLKTQGAKGILSRKIILGALLHLISNYITKPSLQTQHGTSKDHILNSEIEQRTQKYTHTEL